MLRVNIKPSRLQKRKGGCCTRRIQESIKDSKPERGIGGRPTGTVRDSVEQGKIRAKRYLALPEQCVKALSRGGYDWNKIFGVPKHFVKASSRARSEWSAALPH